MSKFSIFSFALFLLLIHSFCGASKQDDKFVKVELKAIYGSYYSIHFCVPNKFLNRGQVLQVELNYGGEINKYMELILAEKENTKSYRIYKVDFDKAKISSDKNIFLRFVFLPISKKEKKFVLYYNMSYILSNVKASENMDSALCGESTVLAPVRVGGADISVQM